MPPDQEELSKKTKRQIRRYFKHEDAVEKLKAFSASLSDEYETEKEILSGFSEFVATIDKSYAEYEDRIKMAVRNLELSSSELNEANEELETLNLSINAMLDSLGQGLLFFDESGEFSPVYSKACQKIFHKSPAGQKVKDLIPMRESEQKDFDLWLSIIFDHTSAMDFDDLTELAPSQFMNSDNRYIELSYRPMYLAEHKLGGVLMIATDRTEKLIAEQKLKETEETAQIIMAIAQNRNNFLRFVQDLKSYLSYLGHAPKSEEDYIITLRNLHTYKGLALIFKMNNLGQRLYEAEDELKQSDKKTALSEDTVKSLLSEIEKGLSLAHKIFGKDFLNSGQVKQIQYDELVQYKNLLEEKITDQKVREELLAQMDRSFMAIPIKDCFRAFESELKRIAIAQGKASPEIIYKTEGVYIIPQPYQELFDSLLHLSRNIADHAIESPNIRTKKGKKEAGKIIISAEEHENGAYKFSIKDDGKGIDPAMIRDKLESMGHDASGETDEDVIYHIFDSEFSTQTTVTEISGRGIGMSAIKQNVEALDGTIILTSKIDEGVEVIINFPAK